MNTNYCLLKLEARSIEYRREVWRVEVLRGSSSSSSSSVAE